jgi:hypothetical protein
VRLALRFGSVARAVRPGRVVNRSLVAAKLGELQTRRCGLVCGAQPE